MTAAQGKIVGFAAFATGLAALAALSVLASESRAQGYGDASYQTARYAFDQTKPGRSSGSVLDIDYSNPSDPHGQPPAVRRVVLEAAPGSRYDTSVPGRCTASDAELTLLGEQACPPESKVGVGEVVVDSGIPGPERYVPAHVDFFNNTGQLIFLNTVTGTGARTVIRGVVEGRRITTEPGMLPGAPPDGGSIDTVHIVDPAYTVGSGASQRGYLTTPPSCPGSGLWTNAITFTYANGATQTTTNSTPCEAGKKAKKQKRCRRRHSGKHRVHARPRCKRHHHHHRGTN